MQGNRETEGGVCAVHLVCYLGNLDILKILLEKFNADFSIRTNHGLTPLHCAAHRKEGIVSIFFLKDKCKDFDPNVTD